MLRHTGSTRDSGFDVIGEWRAASLRDGDNAAGIAPRAAVVFTMAALVAVDWSDVEFEAVRSAQEAAVSGSRVGADKPAPDWWFYPPR